MPAHLNKNGRSTPGRRPIVEEQEPQPLMTPIDASPNPGLPIPYLEDEEGDAPPIPIPAPRSQTPLFVQEHAVAVPKHDPPDEPFSYGYGHGHGHAHPTRSPRPTPPSHASGLARTIRASVTGKRAAPAVPVVDLGTAVSAGGGLAKEKRHHEEALWARWDVVSWAKTTTRLLFVVYASTLRVWDTTDLENVGEVLRISYHSLEVGDEDVKLACVGVLPGNSNDKPLIGLAFNTGIFIIYSLNTHRVVSRFTLAPANIDSFQATEDVIVISTTSPPGLHIFSRPTCTPLSTIPGAQLALHDENANMESVGASARAMLSGAFGGARMGTAMKEDDLANEMPTPPVDPDPKPVYALSRRLLAYACVLPSSSSHSTATSASSHVPGSRIGTTQTQIQTQAQSVWEGMRTLGGLAVSAARSRIAGGTGAAGAGTIATGMGRFFSRSAPEPERGGPDAPSPSPVVGSGPSVGVEGGAGVYIRVVDLHAQNTNAVVEFKLDRERSGVSKISFTRDGCSIGVVGRDGTGMGVFAVRPCPCPSRVRTATATTNPGEAQPQPQAETEGTVWSVYHLRRGRTRARVDGVEWSADARWVGLGTRRGTVHLFAVNPYGGPADWRSHWEGRVRNARELQPMPTEMGPLVRLRVTSGHGHGHGHGQTNPPLAFTFVEHGEILPKHLIPTHSSSLPSSSPLTHPRSYSSQHTDPSSSPPPRSPSHAQKKKRPTNVQDVLVFDPRDVSLSLRRVVVEMRSRDSAIGIGVVGVTSISLPGMGFAGSPSSFGQRIQQQPHQEREDAQMELGARESTVMVWSLGGWGAGDGVRKVLGVERAGAGVSQGRSGRADWLAQAELSTCSKSSMILPRSVYLSHQFSFHTLGEDYHALIRRYQLDIGGLKIDVRREVQVSAYGEGTESFVDGFQLGLGLGYGSPRDIHTRHSRTLSLSFDEPLASALASDIEHHPPRIAGVLPMLPNGTPGSRPQSFRNAIPIRRAMARDGVVGESLGRLIGSYRVRSPGTDSAMMSVSVPLEFDEEDEDFVGGCGEGDRGDVAAGEREREASLMRGDNEGSGSGDTSTPATSTSEDDWERKMETRDDPWGGWSECDRVAVEELERFDDIDVLGFLDEEHEQQKQQQVVMKMQGAGGKRKGRGKRR